MPDLSLDLRFFQYLLVSAEHGSFRRAALTLGVPQSTVSRRVALLEHRLGFALFERDARGVRLTTAGHTFLIEAASGVEQLGRATQLARSTHRGDRGEIHIGILASLGSGFLHDLLKAFREKHGDVRVKLHEATPQTNLHQLAIGLVDVCLLTGEPMLPGYLTELLWEERVKVVLPREHPLAAESEISWDALRGLPFIVSGGGAGPETLTYLTKRLSDLGSHPDITVHDVGRESLLNLVSMGYGLTLVSSSSRGAETNGVVLRPIAGGADVVPSSAIWSANNTNPALKRLIALARDFAKDFKPESERLKLNFFVLSISTLVLEGLSVPLSVLDQWQ